MAVSDQNRETALVTGASSGIGLELAKCFAAEGTNVVLVARRKDRLDQLAISLHASFGIEAIPIACNLASDAERQNLIRQLDERGFEIDVLVNNAGFGLVGKLANLSKDEQLEMIRLNVMALTELTREFIPAMLRRGRGRILNVASTAAFQPGPGMAVYFATKAFVLSLSEAVAEETRGTGVRVTCLCPGPTSTEFGKRSRVGDTVLFKFGTQSAEQVARLGYRAVRQGRTVAVSGWVSRIVVAMLRFSPRWFTRRVAAHLTTMVTR